MEIYSCRQRKAISHVFLILILFPISFLICPLSAYGQTDSGIDALRQIGRVFAHIAEKASPAVVHVEAERTTNLGRPGGWVPPFDPPSGHFFGEPFYEHGGNYYYFYRPHDDLLRLPQPKSYVGAQGSGFIVSGDGYILTAEFVVGRAKKIKVKLADKRQFEAKLIGTDSETGIAVLKINADKLPFLELGDSDALVVGDWVVALSSPFGPAHPFAGGMVTAKGRTGLGFLGYEDFIQTDTAITSGSGGGPLLNLDGRVVGINCAIVVKARPERVSFAIPINMAKFAYKEIVENGKIERGFLGVSIQDVDPDMAKALELEHVAGVVVSDVIEDSAAEKAGIRQHDVIVELNGQPLQSANQLRIRIGLLKPGTQIELVVLRDGKRETFGATLGTRSPAQQVISGSPGVPKRLGFSVQDLTPELAEHLGYRGETGVVVTQVEAGSEAARQGLTAGALIFEVNRQPVKNVRDFNRAIEQGRKKGSVLLLVKDKQRTRFVLLRLR